MLQRAFSQLLTSFSQSCLQQGMHLAMTDSIMSIKLSEGLLHARVKGGHRDLFDVYADLKTWPTVPARCQCGTRLNCEHAAAILLSLRMKSEVSATSESPLDRWIQTFQATHVVKAAPTTVLSIDMLTVIDESSVEWYGAFDEAENGWFSYELGMMIDGKKWNLVPFLVQWLEQYDLQTWSDLSDDTEVKLPISSTHALSLTVARLRPFMSLLLYDGRPFSDDASRFQLRRAEWLAWEASLNTLTAAKPPGLPYPQVLSHLREWTTLQLAPPVVVPDCFLATLRPYQQQGVNWLQLLRSCEFHGVLADDMGLGKTVQTLAHLVIEKEAGRLVEPALIVAPLTLIENWRAEATRFAPTLNVLVHHGPQRSVEQWSGYDVIVSTYGLVLRDKALFLAQALSYLILDEAQWIKNARAKITLVMQRLNARHRLCLSGTPFENHLGELWSLFHFLMPGFLGDKRRFKKYYQVPIEKHGEQDRQVALMKRIQPFLLRRTKQQVEVELPPKTTIIRSIALEGVQRDLYEGIRMSMEKRVREAVAKQGLAKSQLLVLDALLKLRQVCCDPRLVKAPLAQSAYGTSAKGAALMELLETLIAEGRKVLIFSQFTTMLSLIEEAINQRQYRYLKLTGQSRDRQQLVTQFQTGDIPIFLMSLKAGGVGLNLTQADTVIHYDPWWNPAVEAQATDRTHRIGQAKPVFVYRLVASGTVEEVMMEMQARKRALFEGTLSGQSMGGMALSEQDLELFFQPL